MGQVSLIRLAAGYNSSFPHTSLVWGSGAARNQADRSRFAAITYGRPVGINDEDCNVTMPANFTEAIYFDEASHADEGSRICFSPYQTELNKLYMIASPVIRTVYGNRLGRRQRGAERDAYLQLVQDVTGRLWEWQQSLPPHLKIDLSQDCPANMTAASKAHLLQSLALQLTFDNLLIIIHRPFLTQQIDTLREDLPNASNEPHSSSSNSRRNSTSFSDSPSSSPRQWWDAAVRTAKVTELPQLAQLATDSHLVAFLAINLFNSAIVMVVMALAAPLSDKAQEVKRTISRVFRLQQAFGRRSKLSTQSTVVLRNVIQLLLRREADAILTPVVRTNDRDGGNNDSNSPTKHPISIKETLNLPLGYPMRSENQGLESESFNDANAQLSYNESLASVQRGMSLAAATTCHIWLYLLTLHCLQLFQVVWMVQMVIPCLGSRPLRILATLSQSLFPWVTSTAMTGLVPNINRRGPVRCRMASAALTIVTQTSIGFGIQCGMIIVRDQRFPPFGLELTPRAAFPEDNGNTPLDGT